MPIDTQTELTPGWWLARLTRRLNRQRERAIYLERLYRGQHDLPPVPTKYRTLFRMFQSQARTNYLGLVVEAPLERMNVDDFRVGGEVTGKGDDDLRRLWQTANMDADQVVIHRSMLATARAYTLVAPHPRKPDVIAITPEFPTQVITEAYPEDRREIRMSLKMWEDDVSGHVRANLYTTPGEAGYRDGRLLKFQGPMATNRDLLVGDQPRILMNILSEWDLVSDEPTMLDDNPFTVFENRPGADFWPRAEFEDVISIQDRINATIFHRLVAEAFGSFRQKAILNYVYDEDPDGNAIPPDLKNDPGSSWIFERDEEGGQGVSLFEFSQTQTEGIIKAAESDIKDIAAITRTPPHYMLNSMRNIGGDALKMAETGLVSKVRREHMPQAAASWQSTIRKAAMMSGLDHDLTDCEVIWADPESRSMSELYDAAVKAAAAGMPWRTRMELLGFTPPEIDRMDALRTADALTQALTAPMAAQTPGQGLPGHDPSQLGTLGQAAPPAPQNGAQGRSGQGA